MKLLFNGGDYRADASDINVTPTGGGGGGEGWRCPQTSTPSSVVSTSDSRQIVVNPSGCRTGWVAVRKFNKAIIILSVLVLVNYCNGLSAVPSSIATASAIIPGDAEQWDQTYYQEYPINESDDPSISAVAEPTMSATAKGLLLDYTDDGDVDGGGEETELVKTKAIEKLLLNSVPVVAAEIDYDSPNYDGVSGSPTNRWNAEQQRLYGNQSNSTKAAEQLNQETDEGRKGAPVDYPPTDVVSAIPPPSPRSTTIAALELLEGGVGEDSVKTVKSRRRRNNHHQHHHHEEDRYKAELMDRERADDGDNDKYGENTRQLDAFGSNKPDPKLQLNSSSSSAATSFTLQKRAKTAIGGGGGFTRSHRHQKKNQHARHQKHHQRKKQHTEGEDEEGLEKRHRKYAKERYQRKLEKAHKMQRQREQKLELQTYQLAELERQHQARQKVYFGNFAEDNRQFDSIADIDQHIDGGSHSGGSGGSASAGGNRERYPNLARLQTQLKEDRDKDLPPYVRKFNRRNKQLFDLIEGTHSPVATKGRQAKQHHHHHHHRHTKEPASGGVSKGHNLSHKEKIERWIEENLFEEQRRNPNQIVRPPEEDAELLNKLNALPGELGPAADDDGQLVKGTNPVNVITNRLSQTRAGNFVYHRIAQSQPSNPIGQAAAAYGVIVRKPGLPFVAITDRRQEHSKPKHV